jgi:probable rRNA maturation factor
MTLALSDDAQLHELNRQFLEVDAPTDVLSFPSGETDPDSQALYLGDVIISYPRAQAQAVAGGHAVDDELQLLAVHGALHLLGHDHANDVEKAVMWALQARALEALGCPLRP